jgi:hypothetical protein
MRDSRDGVGVIDTLLRAQSKHMDPLFAARAPRVRIGVPWAIGGFMNPTAMGFRIWNLLFQGSNLRILTASGVRLGLGSDRLRVKNDCADDEQAEYERDNDFPGKRECYIDFRDFFD